MKIGFIGQGWIGKHYADDFEARGHTVVRYALEEPYRQNREAVASCDIVFIAVPTPSTPRGFDDTALRSALSIINPGGIAVIKSTLLPGRTDLLQAQFTRLTVMHSPEFLVEKTAAYDAAHPARNIIGITKNTPELREKAELVLKVLPKAPFSSIMSAREAELLKYFGNCFLAMKVLITNMFYDHSVAVGADWDRLHEALIADPRIGASHSNPVHGTGRGAGGHCFIKDFDAWSRNYRAQVGDESGTMILDGFIKKNIELLKLSNKDLDLLRGVYGDAI